MDLPNILDDFTRETKSLSLYHFVKCTKQLLFFSAIFSSAICYANRLKRKIRNASTKIYKTYTDSRLKLKILERKDRQILIAVHSSGGSRPSDKGGHPYPEIRVGGL